MTGNSDGTKISQRKRCEPAKKNKVTGQKHRCMPNCASIQSHRVSIVVYLNLSTMWHPDTKVLSTLPEYSGKWLLIVKGLSNWVFALKSAGLKIPIDTLEKGQTQHRHSCLLKQTPLAFFTLGYMTHKAEDVLILNYAYYTCEFLSVIQIE